MSDETIRDFSAEEPVPREGARRRATVDSWLGQTLAERYVIESRLGAGGMGTVYRGNQVSMNRPVAIKLLPEALSQDVELVRRFLREARLASALSHPNTVTLHDFGQLPNGTLYLVMELVEGSTLERHLADEGRFSEDRAVAITMQLLDALEEAHGRGIVHRDLKPSNIIVSPRRGLPDFVKLLDFGLARGGDSGTGETTMAGAVIGTPAYMSPEQGRGHTVDARSDLYSVGVILFEMLTGRRPFDASSSLAVMWKHMQEPAPRLADRCPELGFSEALEAVVSQSLAKDREARFATAADMRAALRVATRRVISGVTVSGSLSAPSAPTGAVTPSVVITPVVTPAVRGRRSTVLFCVAAAAVLGLGLVAARLGAPAASAPLAVAPLEVAPVSVAPVSVAPVSVAPTIAPVPASVASSAAPPPAPVSTAAAAPVVRKPRRAPAPGSAASPATLPVTSLFDELR